MLGNGSGDPPLDRIFQLDKSTPNYITVLLGRADDPKDPIQGNLTIGEVLPGYSNLTSQPKLNVTVLPNTEAVGQHWQTLLDADGIIGPNGRVVDVTTGVASTSNDKQLTVVFDTGYTLAQVPRYKVHFLPFDPLLTTEFTCAVLLQRHFTRACLVQSW